MGRIASHLVGMGAYGLDLGTFSPFLYAFRERERILDLFEEACGARLTYSYLTVGGATADLPPRLAAEVRSVSRRSSMPIIAEYHALLTTNSIFVKRTAGIGVMSAEMAIDYGCTRPGAARQRRRPRSAPRRRRALHRNVRRLRLRSDRREERPLPEGSRVSGRAAAKRCSAIVGIGSTCGCSKSCSRSTSCARRSIATARRRATTASRSS